ncbi:hypothetical protein BG452_13535 [Streptomyces sp. CBMA123]|nr:hypothetical protein [Streptomyces sp. CBMA123]
MRGCRVDPDALRAELERRWENRGEALEAICRYALLPAGKLVRPLLCLESAVAVGGRAEQVMPAALGMEYSHVASLVHDDIIDGDDLRRGSPSVQHLFGIDHAILTGDMLIFTAFQALAECEERGVAAGRVVAALRVIAGMGADLTRGATAELTLAGNAAATLEAYLTMIRLKTAALIRGACQVGAILGGGDLREIHALSRYGEELGIAFQIQDDLLPYGRHRDTMGKPADSDLRNRRPTLPILLAHQSVRDDDRALIEQMLTGRLPPGSTQDQISQVVDRSGAVSTARAMAHRHAAEAREALTGLAATPSRDWLANVIDELIARVR